MDGCAQGWPWVRLGAPSPGLGAGRGPEASQECKYLSPSLSRFSAGPSGSPASRGRAARPFRRSGRTNLRLSVSHLLFRRAVIPLIFVSWQERLACPPRRCYERSEVGRHPRLHSTGPRHETAPTRW